MTAIRTVIYKDGEPCKHKGCQSHLTHCCEGCGRIMCKGEVLSNELMKIFDKQKIKQDKK